jgi:hypothetical protein
MAHILGLSQPTFITAAPAPMPPAGGTVGGQGVAAGGNAVIDGTPVRVVVICLAAAAGLAALGAAGLKFSIGAST